jgi:hypothetical protein
MMDRLFYEEYIILAGSHSGLEGLDVSDTVEIPKMPDIKLLHPALIGKHMPLVMQQVDERITTKKLSNFFI